MSDIKIALVAEGLTDKVVIEAALSCILPHPFVLTLLQPNSANSINGGFSKTGTGWVGVYRWCRQMAIMSERILCKKNGRVRKRVALFRSRQDELIRVLSVSMRDLNSSLMLYSWYFGFPRMVYLIYGLILITRLHQDASIA